MIDFKSKQIKILPYIIDWMMVLLGKTELCNKKTKSSKKPFHLQLQLEQ